jgi:hypothetical protein
MKSAWMLVGLALALIERLLLASGSAEDRVAIREIGQEFHLASR